MTVTSRDWGDIPPPPVDKRRYRTPPSADALHHDPAVLALLRTSVELRWKLTQMAGAIHAAHVGGRLDAGTYYTLAELCEVPPAVTHIERCARCDW